MLCDRWLFIRQLANITLSLQGKGGLALCFVRREERWYGMDVWSCDGSSVSLVYGCVSNESPAFSEKAGDLSRSGPFPSEGTPEPRFGQVSWLSTVLLRPSQSGGSVVLYGGDVCVDHSGEAAADLHRLPYSSYVRHPNRVYLFDIIRSWFDIVKVFLELREKMERSRG